MEPTIEELKAAVEELKAKHVTALEEKSTELQSVTADLTAKQEELDAAVAKAADVSARMDALEAKMAAPNIIGQTDNAEAQEQKQLRDDFFTWVKTGAATPLLARKGTDLQASTDTSGGYAVPDELVASIIKLEHERSPFRQVCSGRSASTPQVEQLVAVGDAASGWVGETTARTQTNTPDLAQRIAVFGEVYARPRAYQHVLEDAFFDVEGWLAEEVSRQFAEVEGVAFLTGDGTNKPIGFLEGLTAPTAIAANDTTGRPEVIASATVDALGASDTASIEFLRSVVNSLVSGYLPGSTWMMNRTSLELIHNFKDANGQYYLNMDIANAEKRTLFGYPVVINEDMGDIVNAAAGTFPIMFGDFKRAFQVIDRVGVSVLRDPYTNPGSIMFYTRKRVGSMRLDANAVKVVTVDGTP